MSSFLISRLTRRGVLKHKNSIRIIKAIVKPRREDLTWENGETQSTRPPPAPLSPVSSLCSPERELQAGGLPRLPRGNPCLGLPPQAQHEVPGSARLPRQGPGGGPSSCGRWHHGCAQCCSTSDGALPGARSPSAAHGAQACCQWRVYSQPFSYNKTKYNRRISYKFPTIETLPTNFLQ